MYTTFESSTVASVWRHRVADSASEVFLVETGFESLEQVRELTYGEVDRQVQSLAAQLRERSVGRRSPVVVHMGNSIDFVVALLAVLSVDAVAVPTIVQYTADELAYVVEHSGAAAVLTSTGEAEKVRSAIASCANARPLCVGGTWSEQPKASHIGAGISDGEPGPESLGETTALLMYTSGTTSRPKGVILSHAACLSAAYGNASLIRLRPEDRMYCVLPLFHVNALFFQLMPALVTGCSVLLGAGFSARAYWRMVREHQVTVGNLTNGPLRILLGLPRQHDEGSGSMRLMMYALPLTRQEILECEERYGVAMSMGWGLTETLACGTRTPTYLEPRHEWQSIGTVSPGWQLRIVDDRGRDRSPGEVGELLVRGPALMTGYFKDPQATRDALVDGWFRTGDLGRVDRDGHVFFHDRLKDVLKVKGENVAASEVEDVVREIRGIADCALVGAPDTILGERPVLFLVASDAALEDEWVLAHCRCRLAPFKVPVELRWVDDLPRTSIGKVRKGELRALARSSAGPVGTA